MRSSSACSYSQRRAIVCAQSSRWSSTSGAQRYSSSVRSKANASASSASSSYTARACPISFCAIDENATSSSSRGAIPVHSESRQPITSSSSARLNRRSFTRLLQAGLDRVPVDTAVLEVELVRPLRHRMNRLARREPERDRLAAPAVLLARPRLCELRVGRLHRARVLERLALAILAEDLPDHATSKASRTHCSCSTNRRRKARRSAVRGPCPVTTLFSSSQSGSVYSQTPSSRLRSF